MSESGLPGPRPQYFTIWIVAIGTYTIVLIDYDRCLAVGWNVEC
jgi:hypothetical protein